MWLTIALGLVLCAASISDLRTRLIPDWLTAPAACLVLVCTAIADPAALPERAAAGLGAGGFLLAAALARPEGMGLGDVKLAALIGLYLGASVVPALLVALLAGSLAGAALWARHGREARGMTIPFAPFLALGALGAVAL
ncbi:MAG: prepilin peptidase [Solirubrobacterales bacterium]|nr:prepilin peptidase [Solirubrobacterales bacterium]